MDPKEIEHAPGIDPSAYERIAPTAWIVAYRRTFTDIPFSQEIFQELDAIREKQGTKIPEDVRTPELTPQLEARYKLLNRLLRAN